MRSSAFALLLFGVAVAAGCNGSSAGPDGGCAVQAFISTNDRPRWFAVDDKNAYWAAPSAIMVAPLCGGDARVLVPDVGAGTLVVSGGTLFFRRGFLDRSVRFR